MAEDKSTVRYIFSVMRDAVCLLAPGGKFVEANMHCASLFGESPEGKNLKQLVHPDDVPAVESIIKRMFDGDGVENFSCRMQCVDCRYVRLRWRTVVLSDGHVLATIINPESSNLKHGDNAMEKDALLKLAESGAGLGFWKLDLATQHLTWSDMMYKIHGLTPEGGEPDIDAAIDFYHPDDREAVQEHLRKVTERKRNFSYTLRLIRADGSERLVACHGGGIVDGRNNVIAIHGTLSDVTDRQVASKNDQTYEKRLQDITDVSSEFVWETDAQGRIVTISGPVKKIMGIKPSELLRRNLNDFAPKDSPDGVFKALASGAMAQKPFFNKEQQILAPNGSRLWLSVNGKPYRGDQGEFAGFRGTALDLTHTKNRLLAIDRLHDLLDRTESEPASALNGLLEIGARYFNLPYGIISHVNDDVYEVAYAISPSNSLRPGQKVQLSNTYCSLVMQADSTVAYAHVSESHVKDYPFYKSLKLESYIGAPVRVGGRVYGTLSYAAKAPRAQPFSDEDIRLMQLLAHWAGYLIDRNIDRQSLARTKEMLKRQSVMDEMTGVYNRRYIRELMDQEFNRARRYKRPLTLLVIDADNFKHVNNTFGAEAGDLALKTMVWACRDNLRETDIVGRYGGEEFVVLLSETNASRGATIAERIRVMVEKSAMVFGDTTINFTVSIGMSEMTGDDVDIMDALRRADHALLQAKADGKNRVYTV